MPSCLYTNCLLRTYGDSFFYGGLHITNTIQKFSTHLVSDAAYAMAAANLWFAAFKAACFCCAIAAGGPADCSSRRSCFSSSATFAAALAASALAEAASVATCVGDVVRRQHTHTFSRWTGTARIYALLGDGTCWKDRGHTRAHASIHVKGENIAGRRLRFHTHVPLR